jgi:hypothetical protein
LSHARARLIPARTIRILRKNQFQRRADARVRIMLEPMN